MPNLQCSVDHCANNSQGLCCRPDIHVGGTNARSSAGTSCRSYVQRSGGYSNSNLYENPNSSLDISCSARNCVFNADRICSANAISISLGDSSETECSSFRQE